MSEKMYVVQVEGYFKKGVTRVEAETLLEPILDVVPFGVAIEEDRGKLEFKELMFLDNREDFDPHYFGDVVASLKEACIDQCEENPLPDACFLVWEMDVDEPKYDTRIP